MEAVNQLMLRQSDRFAAEKAQLVQQIREASAVHGREPLYAKLVEQEVELVAVKRSARERNETRTARQPSASPSQEVELVAVKRSARDRSKMRTLTLTLTLT